MTNICWYFLLLFTMSQLSGMCPVYGCKNYQSRPYDYKTGESLRFHNIDKRRSLRRAPQLTQDHLALTDHNWPQQPSQLPSMSWNQVLLTQQSWCSCLTTSLTSSIQDLWVRSERSVWHWNRSGVSSVRRSRSGFPLLRGWRSYRQKAIDVPPRPFPSKKGGWSPWDRSFPSSTFQSRTLYSSIMWWLKQQESDFKIFLEDFPFPRLK